MLKVLKHCAVLLKDKHGFSVGPDIVENLLHSVSWGSPQETYVAHFSVHRCICLQLGAIVSVSRSEGKMARATISPHKMPGAVHGAEKLCLTADRQACCGKDRQHGNSSVYKLPGQCLLSSVAGNGQNPAAVVSCESALHQSGLYPRQTELNRGHNVMQRSLPK